ncbi:hypothetical protein VIMY103929_18455 [Vibrio mytili]|uniref:Uncharacterized protein n=1 Tax=Vibrio mytili TaxID=50718 RepID=A0A0C3I2B2_9VIBR|nr:hypothetical protein SU60_20875 [Vibrio mytili]
MRLLKLLCQTGKFGTFGLGIRSATLLEYREGPREKKGPGFLVKLLKLLCLMVSLTLVVLGYGALRFQITEELDTECQ